MIRVVPAPIIFGKIHSLLTSENEFFIPAPIIFGKIHFLLISENEFFMK